MGNVVEFPRKLEWQAVESWVGRVPSTHLVAKVEGMLNGNTFSWYAWNGHVLVATGIAKTLEEGKETAKRALENNLLVVRALE